MRYPAAETAQRHSRLLDEAAKRFRERGFSSVSVAEVMQAAGMTHGAFYAHFESKEALARAGLERAMDETRDELNKTIASTRNPKSAYLDRYLSEAHRDHSGSGCALPALAAEVSRTPATRAAFTQKFKLLISNVTSGFTWRGQRPRQDEALAFYATIVGAVILARAVNDAELSGEILRSARDQLRA